MSANDSAVPRDKKDLLERIEREWSMLLRAIESVTPEQMSAPMAGGWSIKDNLAHLAAWERFMVRCYLHGELAHQAMQIDAETFARLDEDGINAIIQERSRQRPAADVLADLQWSHAEVLKALEPMSYAELMRSRDPDDPEKRPLIGWVIGNTYEHYSEHRQNIERRV
jgi:uncharacterized protein (TIGR03083 family)